MYYPHPIYNLVKHAINLITFSWDTSRDANDYFLLNQYASVISVKIYGRHNVFWSGRLIHINVPAKTILVQFTHFFPS
ncbi:hypothetical protein PRUPE_6G328000 [Prunus persica]|uniref:Uncharacterized protein n=1 Tax=Prunus persica TaxID=3760 RepID=A0A251NZ07_PRUPE|nr:hypothetical protein PRUPE_6G328000 [Prunus persica]